MVIESNLKFKSKIIPKPMKSAYGQLHVLEFDALDLLVKNPLKGYDEESDGDIDMRMFHEKITELIDSAPTDIYTAPYNFDGEGTLIDFRGCYPAKGKAALDTKREYPDMPAAIAAAMAYAASLRYTAIAIIDQDDNGTLWEEKYPGILTFLKQALKEHGIHEEMWTRQE